MNEDIYRERLKDLEDSMRRDQNLLKKYEDELRYETDPGRMEMYHRKIEGRHESLNRHRQEYDKLKNGEINGPPLIPLDPIPAVGIFIDREEDIKKIQSFFEEGVCRLVIIQGFPGIGKTLLAAKLSKLIHPPFKDVLWIKCQAEQSSPDVLFAKFHAFFEENEDHSLLGIWNDMKPELFNVKINRMIRALNTKC